MTRGVTALIPTGVAVALITLAGSADATLDRWEINEIYSNADGTVQFIELYTTEDLQHQLSLASILSNLSTFPFEVDLPDSLTAFHFILIGTQSYGQAPGAVAPDYTVPDNFFSVDGDAINFADVDAVTFDLGELPIDGDLSIDANLAPGPNSPINFAFEEGHVLLPEPGWALLQGPSLVILALFARRRIHDRVAR